MLWKLFSSEKKLNEALENANESYDLSLGVLPLPSNDDIAAQNEPRLYLDNEAGNKEPQPLARRNRMLQLTPPASTSRLYLEDWSEKDEERLHHIKEDEDCWSGFLARS